MNMSTSILNYADRHETGANASDESFLHRMWTRFIAWQDRRAETYIKQVQSGLSPETLERLGYSTEEIAAIRKRDQMGPLFYWS